MDFVPSSVNPVFGDMLAQLQHAVETLPESQRQMMSLTGVAWSDDRLVKVVVGPRGQLVDLKIDPRVFRKPDASELQAKIVATSVVAVGNVTDQVQEIMDAQLPPDFAELRSQLPAESQFEDEDPLASLMLSDAEIVARRKDEHE